MGYIVNLAIAGQPALVVGAGNVASRKVQDLLEAGAEVTVVAPVICPEIQALAGRVRLLCRAYSTRDIQGVILVIAATDDEALNARISHEARSAGVLVNVVDRPSLCSFTVPAVIHRGDFSIAVSTEGHCPALAGVIREDLSVQFDEEWAEVVQVFSELRREMIARAWNGSRIRGVVRQLYNAEVVAMIRARDRTSLAGVISDILGPDFPVPSLAAIVDLPPTANGTT